MENASKALIIAGAILISILLIGIGIVVMNSINAPMEQAQDEATQQAIQMFNSKFSSYAGTQTPAAVKALLTAVQSSNGTNDSRQITAAAGAANTIGAASTDQTLANISIIQANLNNQRRYNVAFIFGSGNNHPIEDCPCGNEDGRFHQGYIIGVTITEVR